MLDQPTPLTSNAASAIARLLEREHLMTLALCRADGWPHATTVGYVNEGFNLYFVIARASQKFTNLLADSRAAAVIRAHDPVVDGAVGVTLAGHALEVTDPRDVERFNDMIIARFSDRHVYCPSGDAVALMRLTPHILTPTAVSGGRSVATTYVVGEADPGGTRSTAGTVD